MKKILVVEDEYYARKSIVKILQESDLDIQVCGEAVNGMKAIELLEEYKDIALVITDIQMKKMGGLELASYLHKHRPEIDILILTAFVNFDYAIAKIGERPVPFMSVMTNEANLIKRFGITTVPISPVEICNRARKILEEKGKEYIKYEEEFVRKFPDGENFQQICATKLAVQELMEENNCSVAAFECWSAFPTLMGLCPCVVLGEMADNGMPLSCETDINGAITLAILRACNLFEESEFLADLTIRHPQNDNAELLWHCGPFPYSLKKDGVEAKLVDGQERFELKQGDLTVCRFDDIDGEYYLFAGEAKTTTGPKTNGTYVWMETDNWKRWEEKLMFGPYIHHLGCVYGHYLPVLREVSRYLGIHFDNAHEQGIYSL